MPNRQRLGGHFVANEWAELHVNVDSYRVTSSRNTRPCAGRRAAYVPVFFPFRSLPLASSLLGDFGPADTASHLATGLGIGATRIDLELLTVTYGIPSLPPVLSSKPLWSLSFHAYDMKSSRYDKSALLAFYYLYSTLPRSAEPTERTSSLSRPERY